MKPLLKKLERAAGKSERTADFAHLRPVLLEVIAASETSAALLGAFSREALFPLTFGEESYPGEVVDALLDKAETFSKPTDRARTLGLVARIGAVDESAVLFPRAHAPEWVGRKPRPRAALARHLERVREGTMLKHARLRAAYAQALASMPVGPDAADLERLVAATASKQKSDSLALLLVATASIAHGLDMAPAALRARCRALAADEDPLLACAAHAALGLLGIRLDAAGVAALASAIRSPRPLPRWWGWRGRRRLDTGDLAVRVLSWAAVDAASGAIAAIAARERTGWLDRECLLRLAFPEGLPPLGVVLAELDADQRDAVAAFGRGWLARDYHGLNLLGLHLATDVAEFLGGEGTLWRGVALDVKGKRRAWHLPRLWRAAVWAELEPGIVGEVVAGAGFEPRALLETMCATRFGAILAVGGRQSGAAERARHQMMTLEVLERLGEFDVAAALLQMAGRSWDLAAFGLCALHALAGGADVGDALDGHVASGLARAATPEPTASLLAGLPEARREAIVALEATAH